MLLINPVRRLGPVALFVFALAACGGDDGGGAADAGADSPPGDAGDVIADSDTWVENCEGVPVAVSPGAPCGGFTPCGAGLQCSRLDAGDEEGVCRQVCVPRQCERVCGDDEVCVPLTDSPGSGVCVDMPSGARTGYETCSDAVGFCEASLTCLVGAAGAEEGVCLPDCTDAECPTVDGRGAQCVIRVNDGGTARSYCAPECSAVGADEECPGDMQCFESGPGFVCAFPQ